MLELIRGNIVYASARNTLTELECGGILMEGGAVARVMAREECEALLRELNADEVNVEDMGDCLIAPSFSDIHLHAPQYTMMGLGMDLPLIDWLNKYTFVEEARFSDESFARKVYSALARELISLGTTRVAIFGTVHVESTLILMEELERAGVTGYAGKVNMDRNGAALTEDTQKSLEDTRRFIEESRKFKHIKPIITPRFTPACTDALMKSLGDIAREYGLPIQSHLSENDAEIEWVRELCPDCEEYADSYIKAGLWRKGTIMAHCVHSSARERGLLKKAGVWVAHCPDSNTNIYSGVAPVRRMLDEGLNIALGSDVAGGASLSMRHTATEAIRASKLRYFYTGKAEEERFLTVREAFYLATTAGARYFAENDAEDCMVADCQVADCQVADCQVADCQVADCQVAGFPVGKKLHALALDDKMLAPSRKLTLAERLERLMYADDRRNIAAVWSEGIRRL